MICIASTIATACICKYPFSGPCPITPVTLSSSYTVSTLGSTAVSGSFTCSFQVITLDCGCSVTVKWLRGSTIVNSAHQYTIATQYTSDNSEVYTSTLSVSGNVSASHAGSYHCWVVSSWNSIMITKSSSLLNLMVQSK